MTDTTSVYVIVQSNTGYVTSTVTKWRDVEFWKGLNGYDIYELPAIVIHRDPNTRPELPREYVGNEGLTL